MEAQDFLFPEHPSTIDFTTSCPKLSPDFMNVPTLGLCNGNTRGAQLQRQQIRVKGLQTSDTTNRPFPIGGVRQSSGAQRLWDGSQAITRSVIDSRMR